MEYRHGGNAPLLRKKYPGKNIIDLSANINPLGIPKGFIDAIKNSIPSISEYPDIESESLITALSKLEKVSASYIIVGNGASELIFNISFALKPKSALLLAPSFSEYEKALRASGAEVIYSQLKYEENFFVNEKFLNDLKKGYDIAFICNPNNPTGSLIDQNILEKAVEIASANETTLVIDECFLDFCHNSEKLSAKKWIDNPNVIVIRALTKIFAVPGLRIGYMISSSSEIRDKIKLVTQSWPLSTFAEAIANEINGLDSYVEETKRYIELERPLLVDALESKGIKVFRSDANFIFFRASPKFADLVWEEGFLVRRCANFVGLDENYFRICIGASEDSRQFIDALAKLHDAQLI